MPTAIFASPVILMWSWLEALQILADVQNQLVSSIGETAIPILVHVDTDHDIGLCRVLRPGQEWEDAYLKISSCEAQKLQWQQAAFCGKQLV